MTGAPERIDRRELALVLLVTAAVQLTLATRPYHLDEPAFLAIAHNIIRQPLHPLSFSFNWYGVLTPQSDIITNPLGFPYLLAAALKLGGGEALTRAAFLPFDLAAAALLYLLAGRFLKAPLWPCLLVLLNPAYVINMSQLIPERAMACFAFGSLYALARAGERRGGGWYYLSAALAGACLLFKYAAVFLFVPALGCSLALGIPLRRLAAYLLVAALPLGSYAVADYFLNNAISSSARDALQPALLHWWVRLGHTARALLSFAGGGSVALLFLPLLLARRTAAALAAAACCALFFLPAFDLNPSLPIDRASGAVLSAGALLAFLRLLKAEGKGAALWRSWTAGVVIVLALYHSVVTRLVAFMIAPLLFSLAEELEARLPRPRLQAVYAWTLAAVLPLTAALAAVDYRYASAQRDAARLALERYAGSSKRVWFTGHWGLQYYLERAGSKGLDAARGGWDVVRAGDVVVSPVINGDVFRSVPDRTMRANVELLQADFALPLRLQGRPPRQCGFYSSNQGYLPFCLARAPVEEFRIVERL